MGSTHPDCQRTSLKEHSNLHRGLSDQGYSETQVGSPRIHLFRLYLGLSFTVFSRAIHLPVPLKFCCILRSKETISLAMLIRAKTSPFLTSPTPFGHRHMDDLSMSRTAPQPRFPQEITILFSKARSMENSVGLSP